MFEIKNGVMYNNDKKAFGIGAAYYASFHNKKMAVPPFEDQLSEMKKDIAKMKEVGFNIVRTSALGEFNLQNGGSFKSLPLIEEMMKEIEKQGLAAFMRIQGYSMKLDDYKDSELERSDGKLYSGKEWANFLNDSLYHPDVLNDNNNGTRIIADFYKNMNSVIAFLTYNEPHYPGDGVYDYSKYAIEAYRNWLKENNINISDDIDNYTPPRRRPLPGENIEEWVYWRIFSAKALSGFLNNTAGISKAVNPKIQSITCMTPNMVEYDNFIKGADYFEVADGMDMLGITIYKNSCGGDYYAMDLILNSAESAAAVCQKHAWMVELDAGMQIPIDHFIRETFMTVGSGYKGIVYYQWRGDYPFEGAPEPDMFGFIHSDGSKSDNYDEKIGMLKVLDELSEKIANSEKLRSGAAILFSDYAAMYSDAVDNIHSDTVGVLKNTYNSRLRRYYKELKCEGITPDIIKAEHLDKLNTKLLLVPEFNYLSKSEKEMVREFAKNGGKVFLQAYDKWQNGLEKSGFIELDGELERYTTCYELAEVLEYAGVTALYEQKSKARLGVNIIENDSEYIMSIVNISNLHEMAENVKIHINADITNVEIHASGEKYSVEVKDNEFTIPRIKNGVIAVISK